MTLQTRAGQYQKNPLGQATYLSFCPTNLPPNPPIEIDDELRNDLVKAHRLLAILDEKVKNIPSLDLFVSMYVQKEALLSSQIEGTQATLEDIFNPTIDANINADVSDVVNYTNAINYGIKRLETLPLCSRLLLEIHKILMSGVRGKEKNPGEFRRSQNWIGGEGSTITTARYVPPNLDTMQQCLTQLEKFMNKTDNLDHLVKAALIHYQFETIHPFLDGNGRVGRLLIILYLLEKKIIHTPCLYLSTYLKANRIEYYDRMSQVRTNGDYEQWIRFFIKGIIASSQSAIETAEALLTLDETSQKLIQTANYTTRTKQTVQAIYEYLKKHPIIEIGKTANELNMAYNTVANTIKRLETLGILKLAKQQKRNKIYIYQQYLDILNENS